MASEQLALTRATKLPNPSKATRQAVPAFLNKLYSMVSDPNTDELIKWSDEGDSFFVPNHERFGRELLPRFFKHGNFASFVRQLNMYGFHKVPQLQQGVLKNETETELWQFVNQNFRRGQPDLLCLITRNKKPPGASGSTAGLDGYDDGAEGMGSPAPSTSAGPVALHSIASELAAIKRHQTSLSADLKELQMSNQALWQESLEARERHKKHQDTINRILKFLAGVFGSSPGTDGATGVGGSPSVHGNDGSHVPRKRPRLMIGPGSDHRVEKDNTSERVQEHEDLQEVYEDEMNESDIEPLDIPSAEGDDSEMLGLSTGHISEAPSPADTNLPSQSATSPSLQPDPTSPPTSSSLHQTNKTASPGMLSALFTPSSTGRSTSASTSNIPPVSSPLPFSRAIASSTSNSQLPPSHSDSIEPASTYSTDPNDPLYAATLASLLNSPNSFQRMMSLLSQQQQPPQYPDFHASNDPSSFYNNSSLTPFTSPTKPHANTSDSLSSLALLSNNNTSIDHALGNETEKLQKVYNSAAEIDADVAGLSSSIESFMQNLGLDQSTFDAMVPPSTTHDDHSAAMDSAIDWDALLNYQHPDSGISTHDVVDQQMEPPAEASVTEATPSTTRSEPSSPAAEFLVIPLTSPTETKSSIVKDDSITKKRKSDALNSSPDSINNVSQRTRRATVTKSPVLKKTKVKRGKN